MCGRFTNSATPKKIKERYKLDDLHIQFTPRYNIAPSQDVPVIIKEEKRSLHIMKWGLVPSWAKDPAIGYKMINARAEGIAEKPSFRKPFKSRRCLVPADGFYEWMKVDKGKIPIRFTLPHDELFSFAGLWDVWKDPSGHPLETFTIITTTPNAVAKKVHDRMPVILNPEDEEKWIDVGEPDVSKLSELLKPYSGDLKYYEVSTRVNSPKNDDPECIVPL